MKEAKNTPAWYLDIPDEWRKTRVKAIIQSFDSGVWGEDPIDENDATLIIRSNEIDENGKWRNTIPTLRALSHAEKKNNVLYADELVIVKSSGSHTHIGKTAVVTEDIEAMGCCFSNFVGRIRVFKNLMNSRFLWYFLNNSPGRNQLFYHGTTTTGLINLSAANIYAGVIPLPPLPEQIRITSYLDASCAAIDAAVAAKKKQLDALTALRKETIHRVVTRGLDKNPALRETHNSWIEKIPVGWDLVCLKRISDIQMGLTLGKVYEGPTVERPYLRVANVQDGHLDLTDVTLIEVPLSVASRVRLCVDDVLMTEGGDLDKLGRGFLWKGEIADCLHQNHIFAVRCFHHKLLPMFLTYLTASRYGRDYFEATGKKTTNLAATNSTKVGAFPIPLPPIKEQKRLIAFLDNYLGDLTALFSNIESQIATLIDYRKSLIHECVTGQRRINEADVAKLKRTLEQAAG